MSTNELPREKRTGDESTPDKQTMPEDPPVHPEPLLNDEEPDTDPDHPPQVRLLLTGINRNGITADFLVGIHDLADEHDIPVESISVGRPDRTDE